MRLACEAEASADLAKELVVSCFDKSPMCWRVV